MGNPLQVDINLEKRKESEKKKKEAIRDRVSRMSRDGVCSAEGCNNAIKSKGLCEKHYARMRRNGSLSLNRFKYLNDKCLVFDCDYPRQAKEYCNYHAKLDRTQGSPFKAKVIKLCGVDNCNEIHQAKGLCSYHYREWEKLKESVRITE